MEPHRTESQIPENSRAASPSDSEGAPRGSFVAWVMAFLPLGLSAALAASAHRLPDAVESQYALGLYPKIASVIGAPAGALSRAMGAADLGRSRPSLGELLLVFAVLSLMIWIGVRWKRRGFMAMVRGLVCIVGLGYGAFLGSWGLLYARQPVSETLGLSVQPVQVAELDRVARYLAAELDASHDLLADAGGPSAGYGALAARAWGKAIDAEPAIGWQRDPVLAAPLLSRVLTASGISGIFSPFTQECHVAAGLTDIDRGFVACHEIAHLQGWAREDEANYLAWRVASRSGEPWLRRSALALALLHVHRALARADPELQGVRAAEFSDATLALFEERAAFWNGARVAAAAGAARAVNDRYLKSQGQSAGVASYGRMVDLLIAELR